MTAAQRLARAWFALALCALGASALLAIVLVAARSPFLGLGGSVFRTALVLHVNLGVGVWFLASASGVWTLLRDRADGAGWIGFWLALVGVAAMLLAPALGTPPPVLANYMPVLDNAMFMGGLGSFALAVVVTGVLSLTGGWTTAPSSAPMAARAAARWSVLAVVMAAAVFAIDQQRALGVESILPLTLDDRLWGAGHLLQFAHDLLMMGAWLLLGRRFVSMLPSLNRLAPWLCAFTALATLGGLWWSLRYGAGSPEQRQGYTDLMRWATWPAPLLLSAGLVLGAGRLRARSGAIALRLDEAGLFASMTLYALGCVVGASIRGPASTSVPAHYHGTVGAITVAYLTLVVCHAPAFGIAPLRSRWTRRLPLMYGFGIATLVAGLAWAGLLGVPRKLPHADWMHADLGYQVAMGLAGVGGFIALGAALLLVGRVGMGGLSLRLPSVLSAGGDVRYRAVAISCCLVLVGGALLEWLPSMPAAAPTSAGHVAEKQRAEVELRFAQGVVMLHTKEYDHALTAFHRVIELAPQMPEAYVNTGYALLGLQRYAAARDFFDAATSLRTTQINGYYGLALALEGLGDTFGAMQAMETYLHRAPKSDPYRRKAEAAVWEWRAQLAQAKSGQGPTAAAAPARTSAHRVTGAS